MDLGIYLAFRNPPQWRRPFFDVYRAEIEQALLAEKLGFDHVWLTEHHFAQDAWCPSLLPVLSAIAARTEAIRLGTYIIVLPFHNPVRVAEDAAIVDIISNGRLDLGVGPGNFAHEYKAFGVPRNQRRPRMYEGLEIIYRAFTEEKFSFKGRFHEFHDISLTPKPVQKPHPPLWVAALNRKGIVRAGDRGYNLAGAGSPDALASYSAAARAAGRDPGKLSIGTVCMTYVAESRGKAWDDAEPHLHYTLSSYQHQFTLAQESFGKLMLSETPSEELQPVPPIGQMREVGNLKFFGTPVAIGTPDEAVSKISAYLKDSPVTHMVLWMQLPGLDPAKTRRSMELFAKEVMPALSRR